MDELLSPVTSIKATTSTSSSSQPKILELGAASHVTDHNDALRILKGSPDSVQLRNVLQFLANESPDGKLAQITRVLIAQTIPDWWGQFHSARQLSSIKSLLVDNLREVTALSSLHSRVKVFTASCRTSSGSANAASTRTQLNLLLNVIVEVFNTDHLVRRVYQRCISAEPLSRQEALWREAVSLLGSGRIISAVAETEDVLRESLEHPVNSWVGQSKEYCSWLARNIAITSVNPVKDDEKTSSAMGGLLGKALTLGYQDALIGSLIEALPLHEALYMPTFVKLTTRLPTYQQRNLFSAALQYVDMHILGIQKSTGKSSAQLQSSPALSDCAALVTNIIADNESLKDYIVELCIKIESSVLMRSFALRRLMIASISNDDERIESIVEKLLTKFGDQLFIRHAPALQQEAIAQIILMGAGYIHRSQPMLLFTIAKSSIQMHGISNRLKASSQRSQWLGMIVGMALSELTDKPSNKLVFDDDDMQTAEAKWYQALVHVQDPIGDVSMLKNYTNHDREVITAPVSGSLVMTTTRNQGKNSTAKETKSSGNTSSRIIEIIDDDDDDDEDLVPYAKPDSDPEDEDEDPTLVERNRPRPPVYIRDLLAGLREKENYDHHRLALETSAALIRRKANFGKEVTDHADELLTVLLNMNDQFEMDDFQELRQDALISLLVSQPGVVGPSLAQSCFDDNFSVQQRAAMFTAMALGARELSGHKDNDLTQSKNFPSKELPKHLQQIYGEKTGLRLVNVQDHLEQGMVQPLALDAADRLSGPNALKVRTFSSRVAAKKPGSKMIKNSLAKDVAEWFIFPLIAGWWTQKQSFGSSSSAFSRHLVSLFLRTLAVLLHTSGPSTVALPQLTTEAWDVLLSLRINALHDNDVQTLDALLFGVLTLLELNDDKQRLANEHAKELVETQEWAKLVLDQYGMAASGDESETGKIKMLAAAVVVRCHEAVDRWQRLMLGDLVDV